MAFSYSPKIVTEGLVLYLDAANPYSYPGSGTTWTDLSRSQTNGTLVNGPTFNSANGGSIVFDGVDDYCSLGSSIIPQTSNWTYSSFFNLNTLATGSVLYGQYIAAAFNGRFLIRLSDSIQNSSQFSLFLGSGASYNSTFLYTNTTASINTTYNLTITRENQTFNLYVNGVYDTGSTMNFTASLLQTTPIIGGRTNSGGSPTPVDTDFLNGKVYTTQVYNRALSAQEVLQNYNATKTRFGLT
jgi:hypothetical protein